MTSHNLSNKTLPKGIDIKTESMLTEYRALRTEIITLKGERMKFLYITMGIFGVVASSLIPICNKDRITILIPVLLFISLLLNVIIQQAISIQLHIKVIGVYIEQFIEPHLEGLNWETASVLNKKCMARGDNKSFDITRKVIPAIGNFYSISAITCIISFVYSIFQLFCTDTLSNTEMLIFSMCIIGLIASCLALISAIDLSMGASKKWDKINWKGVCKKDIESIKSNNLAITTNNPD